jgi:putative colanic acid biosynthesis acetyltransferase WcaF
MQNLSINRGMAKEDPYLGQGSTTPYSGRENLGRFSWALVQATLFRFSPRTWHAFRARLLRMFGAEIPEPSKVVIFPTVVVIFPSKLSLAPRSMVGPRVTLYNLAQITLGRGANISQNCHLCAGTHDYGRWGMPLVAKPILIGENTWLGADVFVGPGVSIGKLCVIGARSVVVKDMPERSVCAGNPCRVIKQRTGPAE